ncbi:MAG TPA: RNA methyltransferase [Egibacteraceae bacterium]|nr:RNA methyltransferase [Egibacteraceae bacterium]
MTVVTSPGNAAVKAARKLARRTERARAGEFLVESPEVVREALPHLRRLFVTAEAASREAELVARAEAAGATVMVVTPEVLGGLSDTVTPQGLVGVAALPGAALDATLDEVCRAGAPLVVALSQVRDPGNAGAIIRSADAGGADVVVLTRGSVDPGNPKAVRASAGSVFHLPVVTDADEEALLAACRARGLQVVAAAPRGAVPFTDVDFTRPTAVLFGNEAHGLDDAVVEACDVAAAAPIHAGARPGWTGSAESLNLAATVAVFVYEAARQRHGRGGGRAGAA